MKTFEVLHLHADDNNYSGWLYFLVDDRLLKIKYSTPMSNDYGEWRVTDIELSTKKYDPSGNDVQLSPLDIKPFELSDYELEFLDVFFSLHASDEKIDYLFRDFKNRFPESVNPYETYEHTLLTSGFLPGHNDLAHRIHSTEDEYNWQKMTDYDFSVDITVHNGLHNILIPIMEIVIDHMCE